MMPKHRPTPPGEFVEEDILREFNLTQEQLADELRVSRRTINEIINAKRRITADMALRLGKFTKTSAETWIQLQNAVDLWDAAHSPQNSKLLRGIHPCVA